MRRAYPYRLVLMALALLGASARGDDDDNPPAAPAAAHALPALSEAQRQAVGLVAAHPAPSAARQALAAYGEVLDPGALAADAGRLDSSRAGAQAAAAEAARLDALYRNDANASLRSLQTAQAAQAEAQAQMQAATAAFTLQWGPLARLSAPQRQALIRSLIDGRTLLVRADLPGRRSLDTLPAAATLEVDGARVPARVLGKLPRTSAELQTAAVLLQVQHPPGGLGPGARVTVRLEGAPGAGLLVPAGALLYGEQGPYVYRQLAARTADGRLQYQPAPVQLLQPQGEAWLVKGLDADDLIVVQGAGVLWSLQGLGGFSASEEEHD